MPKIDINYEITSHIGGRKIFKTQMEAVFASFLSSELKRKFLRQGVEIFLYKTGDVAFSTASVFSSLKSKDVSNEALKHINVRFSEYLLSEWSKRERQFPPLKSASVSQRNIRRLNGWKGGVYNPPLTFTGRFKSAFLEAMMIGEFAFFDRTKWDKNRLVFTEPEIKIYWNQNEKVKGLETSFQKYFYRSTLISPKFFHLAVAHAKMGRDVFPSRYQDFSLEKKGDKIIMKPKQWIKQPMYKGIIKPFIKQDLREIFKKLREGTPSTEDTEKITKDIFGQAIDILTDRGLLKDPTLKELINRVIQDIKSKKIKVNIKFAGALANFIQEKIGEYL